MSPSTRDGDADMVEGMCTCCGVKPVHEDEIPVRTWQPSNITKTLVAGLGDQLVRIGRCERADEFGAADGGPRALVRRIGDDRGVEEARLDHLAVGVVLVPFLADRAEGDRHLVEVPALHLRHDPLHVGVARFEGRFVTQTHLVLGEDQSSGLRPGEWETLVVDQQPDIGALREGLGERSV